LTEVIRKSEARNLSGKGAGKGGKGSGKDGKGGPQVIWAQPQGDRRVFPDAEFNKNEIYPKPVILMTAEKFPVPAYDMNDKDKLHELRMESHASFLSLQKILRDFHGDLDSARKPLQYLVKSYPCSYASKTTVHSSMIRDGHKYGMNFWEKIS